MTPPRRGHLKRRTTSQGTSYGVSFDYAGQEFYVHFGGEWEGWSDERAVDEQRYLMGKVHRGEWQPPVREQPVRPAGRLRHRRSRSRPRSGCTAASSRPATRRAGPPRSSISTWRLRLVMDKFGPVPIDRVDYALADELVSQLCEERLAIERRPRARRAAHAHDHDQGPASATRRVGEASRTLRSARRSTQRNVCCATRRSAASSPATSPI